MSAVKPGSVYSRSSDRGKLDSLYVDSAVLYSYGIRKNIRGSFSAGRQNGSL